MQTVSNHIPRINYILYRKKISKNIIKFNELKIEFNKLRCHSCRYKSLIKPQKMKKGQKSALFYQAFSTLSLDYADLANQKFKQIARNFTRFELNKPTPNLNFMVYSGGIQVSRIAETGVFR